jgi:nucleotide-binding universal stress UspA family protein
MFNSILVPIDGSEYSRTALQLASCLASGDDPVIHLINIPETAPSSAEMSRWAANPSMYDNRPEVEKQAIELLKQVSAEISRKDLRVERHVHWLPPAQAIVNAASEFGVEAIVMGSRGLGNVKGMLLGSVSHKVLHVAECRVVLIR